MGSCSFHVENKWVPIKSPPLVPKGGAGAESGPSDISSYFSSKGDSVSFLMSLFFVMKVDNYAEQN